MFLMYILTTLLRYLQIKKNNNNILKINLTTGDYGVLKKWAFWIASAEGQA